MTDIAKNVEKFYLSIKNVENHRYKSWEHCYNFFIKTRNKKLDSDKLELAQLHLAFYLASWGMYRGSSFVLQKDYTIFKKIINEIFKKKYADLWEVEKNISKKDELNVLFSELYLSLEKILKEIRKSVQKHPDFNGSEKRFLKDSDRISPTLITKIILGTIGCIPAYDRFFIEGLGMKGIQKKFNSKKSFLQMIKFYLENKKEFDNLSKKLKGYPLMKILDMYFWIEGYEKLNKL